MEIQALVKAGKMQRIKSTAVLKSGKSALSPGLARSRTVSVNCGASAWHQPGLSRPQHLIHPSHFAGVTLLCMRKLPYSLDLYLVSPPLVSANSIG